MNFRIRMTAIAALVSGLALSGCQSPFSGGGEDNALARGKGDDVQPDDKVKPVLKACPDIGTTILYGGQHIEVGYVDASIADGKLRVRLVGKGWTFTEVHIDVATSAGRLHGSPGEMLHNSGRLSNASEYAAEFDLASLGYAGATPLYIATHAVAHGIREGKDAAETSWGYGTHYGEGWGWYFCLPNALCPGGGGTGTGTDTTSGGGTGTGGTDTGTGSGGGGDSDNT